MSGEFRAGATEYAQRVSGMIKASGANPRGLLTRTVCWNYFSRHEEPSGALCANKLVLPRWYCLISVESMAVVLRCKSVDTIATKVQN